MKEWNANQIKEMNRMKRWLNLQISKSLFSLDSCADQSPTVEILEDIILQFRRIKDAIPQLAAMDC